MISSIDLPCGLKLCAAATSDRAIEHIRIYETIDDVPLVWQELTASASAFLQLPYLLALEQAAPENYRFFYLVFRDDNKAVGVAIAQYFPFDATQQIKLSESDQAWWQRQFIKQFKSNFLVLGNATLTGEHGFYFLPSINSKQQLDYLQKGIQLLENEFVPQTDFIVLKDFHPATANQLANLKNDGFHRINIQPNMQLSLPEHWRTFDDYLNDLRSKYRVRVKRARKKAKDLSRRELSLSEIENHQEKLFELYQLVAQNAPMNVALLPENYFLTLKEKMGDTFHLTVYFDGAEMIGFQTLIQDGDHLEAHFLGLNDNYNPTHQLYLNMLFDMTETAIEKRTKILSFGRTALEIKSSVGAIAQPMYGFIKHRFVGFNLWIPRLFQAFETEEEWVARSPFRRDA